MKKAIPITVIVAAFIVAFVIADYCELLLSMHVDGAVPVRFHFKFQDITNGRLLTDVKIESPGRTVRTPNKSETAPDGITHGLIMIGLGYTKTILFEKPSVYQVVQNKKIEFAFNHPAYRTETRTFTAKQLKQVRTVELTPLAVTKQ